MATEPQYRIFYRHDDCPVQPGVEWEDTWSCACNDDCPACGREIEPVDWEQIGEVDDLPQVTHVSL